MPTTPTAGSLGFRIAEGAASVDPGTAEIRVAQAALAAGLALTVTAYDAAGGATGRWRLTLAAAPEAPGEAPAVARAPALAGAGLVGEVVTLDAGDWTGDPAPALAIAWLRDGTPVAGATEARYLPGAADDATRLAARVTATNAAGSAVAETAPLAIRRPAPVATGRLADRSLVHGAAAAVVEAAAAFAGAGLAFAVVGGGATVDAASGRVSLPADTLRRAEPVTVTATNSGGAASLGFAVTVAPALPAPVAVGTLPDLAWPLAAGSRTVSTQAGFAGEGLSYALEAAPAGATIDAGTGLVTIPTGTALGAARVTVAASNAAGRATQSFAVTVRLVATAFDAAAALAEMSFLAVGAAPTWSLDAGGFARLVPAVEGATHGLWSRSAGDGRYRALVRWSAEAAIDRPLSFTARLAATGSGTATSFAGLRLDALLSGSTTLLELRQYAGSGTASTQLAVAPVAWANDVWTWIEVELEAAAVRARLYPEAAAVPDWQIVATTTHLAAGAAGIGGFGRWTKRPQIDVRRLELAPIVGAEPLAADAGEWTVEQSAERQA